MNREVYAREYRTPAVMIAFVIQAFLLGVILGLQAMAFRLTPLALENKQLWQVTKTVPLVSLAILAIVFLIWGYVIARHLRALRLAKAAPPAA